MFSFARLFVQTNEKVNAVLMSFLGRPSAHRNYRVALDSPKSELSGKKIRQRDLFYQSRLIFLSDKENFSIRGLWFYFVLHVFSCHRHCVCIFSCHCHHFHTAKRGCIRKILYFCPWLSQSLGMGGSRHFGFRVSLTAERVSATSLVGKDVFWTLSSTISNFATLIPLEDTATRRPRWVYYTRVPLEYPQEGCFVWCTPSIIRDGVGWLSCLSQWKGNAKAWYGGISKEVSPTSFLCP